MGSTAFFTVTSHAQYHCPTRWQPAAGCPCEAPLLGAGSPHSLAQPAPSALQVPGGDLAGVVEEAPPGSRFSKVRKEEAGSLLCLELTSFQF